MRRLLPLILISVLLTLSIGCANSVVQSPAPETIISPTQSMPVEPTAAPQSGKVSIELQNAPEDTTWIAPGKVNISNLYPGAQAEYPVTIHNGNNKATTFAVSARIPDYTAEGYEKFPSDYFAWVTIADTSPVLSPKETRDILVIVKMPDNVKSLGKKLEVWISVIDASQIGTVRTELCSRWLVATQ